MRTQAPQEGGENKYGHNKYILGLGGKIVTGILNCMSEEKLTDTFETTLESARGFSWSSAQETGMNGHTP